MTSNAIAFIRSGRFSVTSATCGRGFEISTNDMGFLVCGWSVLDMRGGLLDTADRVAAREQRLHGRQLARQTLQLRSRADSGADAHDLHRAVDTPLVDLQKLRGHARDALRDRDDARVELVDGERAVGEPHADCV